MPEPNHFDGVAGDWDLEDRRVQLARAVAQAILEAVGPLDGLEVLDFGCGTGLVTLALAPHSRRMTGADTSEGMLSVLRQKAAAAGLEIDLLVPERARGLELGGPYDLIVSSMTLHHVEDVPALLRALASTLRPGGRVALADLDLEDGSFHDADQEIPHLGFQRGVIEGWLQAAGFEDRRVVTATTTTKQGRDYSIFLATGRLGASGRH